MRWKNVLPVIILTWLVLSACCPSEQPIEPVNIRQAEMQAFADAFFNEKINTLHIPGLVFIFVQNGEVLYSQGYGYANLEDALPMHAQTSVMRIGSISKSFVATAVMQLVEDGKLDLHRDINLYLKSFKISTPFSQPITLVHILTHTAGFEDPPYISNTDPDRVQPLGVFLAENLPAPAHPPGETFIYSNYGYALAGLIVEEVSGIPFDEYVEQNILQPLGMEQTRYLLRPPVPGSLATGYAYKEGEQIPQPVDYDGDYPGGSILSTADEMSHFILAHLQDGCYEDSCILMPGTLQEMHAQHAETPYEGQGVAYGFVTGTENGARLLGHSGAIRGFGSILNLLPDYDMGYFLSFNEECLETDACQIISDFQQAFIERFLSQE